MTTSPSKSGWSLGSGGGRSGPLWPDVGDDMTSTSTASIGKARTSVGPVWPRNCSFRAAMSSSSTNRRLSSTLPRTPSASRIPSPSTRQRATSTGTLRCSSATKTSGSPSPPTFCRPPSRGRDGSPTLVPVAGPLVGGDDVGHDLVPHDVAAGQVHEVEAIDAGEDAFETDEATAAAGDVDLGHVAGDHRLGAEPDAGEEHLDLLGRGVLGLVEDDEAGVEGAAPHEGERRHLHRLALEELLSALEIDHVVEGIVQRPQVRIDLGHEVAGQEAQPLPRLDRRAGEDDPLDLFGL